jgi:hypothetical protein
MKPVKRLTIDNSIKARTVLFMLSELEEQNKTAYVSLLCKTTDITFAHCCCVCDNLSYDSLIKMKKQGRIKILSLTDKGKNVCKILLSLKKTQNGV